MFGGEFGSGKTYLFMRHPDIGAPDTLTEVWDFDIGRWENDLKYHRPDLTGNVNIRQAVKLNAKLLEDPSATFVHMHALVSEWVTTKPHLIIIDGMSGFRRLALDMWEQKHAAAGGKQEDKMSIADYGWVNSQLETLIKRMIFYTRTYGAQLLVAAHMREVYESGGPLGFGKKTGDLEIEAPKLLKAGADEVDQCLYLPPAKDAIGKGTYLLCPVKSQFGREEIDVTDFKTPVLPAK